MADTHVLFSVWDTRVQDFETFVKSTDYDATGGMYSLGKDGWQRIGDTRKEPGFSQGWTHPVVGVSWNDSKEFCKWLTKRERSAGDLPQDRGYRLPKDEEWSVAVGLKNEVGTTPEEKSRKINLYPWDVPQKRDKSWPPPAGAGNYAGQEGRTGTGRPTGQSLKAITTAIHGLVQWEAFQPTSLGCTTWEAKCGNGAKIGITLRSKPVRCAVRHGAQLQPRRCACFIPQPRCP